MKKDKYLIYYNKNKKKSFKTFFLCVFFLIVVIMIYYNFFFLIEIWKNTNIFNILSIWRFFANTTVILDGDDDEKSSDINILVNELNDEIKFWGLYRIEWWHRIQRYNLKYKYDTKKDINKNSYTNLRPITLNFLRSINLEYSFTEAMLEHYTNDLKNFYKNQPRDLIIRSDVIDLFMVKALYIYSWKNPLLLNICDDNIQLKLYYRLKLKIYIYHKYVNLVTNSKKLDLDLSDDFVKYLNIVSTDSGLPINADNIIRLLEVKMVNLANIGDIGFGKYMELSSYQSALYFVYFIYLMIAYGFIDVVDKQGNIFQYKMNVINEKENK